MSRHALVVDDNEALARTLGDILRLEGWEVTIAVSGSDAVKRVMAHAYDVVLMDIKMPGINGVDAFLTMRSLRPALPVVLMSAYTAPDLIEEARRGGVQGVMSKPVSPPALFALLEEVLREARSVLIVDHDEAYLRTLSDLLRQEGFETVLAEGVAHAAQVLLERRPVAVLLHLHLRDASADEAVKRLKAASPRAPLIVYSGRPDAQREVEEALPPGLVHRFLAKPFAGAKLADVLRGLRDSA